MAITKAIKCATFNERFPSFAVKLAGRHAFGEIFDASEFTVFTGAQQFFDCADTNALDRRHTKTNLLFARHDREFDE